MDPLDEKAFFCKRYLIRCVIQACAVHFRLLCERGVILYISTYGDTVVVSGDGYHTMMSNGIRLA